ncbi:hypothetical protein [Carboxydothermus pertinax]|uniref:Uncharacterized protein n=1 Tax=Carboxydothermus pertinax TaxID=870242 RepID=A0A1L8CYK9_9THEO|nr:hypothetical protein [Carboxydothermus pertinax]GAV23954.1 hypothetical protein cpu_24640 [Carboxydothermus pertinax]
MVYLVAQKKHLLVVGVVIAVLIAGLKIFTSGYNGQELIKKAFEEIEKEASYSYTSEVRLLEKEKVNYLSQVEGIKTTNGAWAKGKILGTPVEILCIDDTTYFRDVQTGKWLTFKGINLRDAQALVNELNPLKVLAFNQIKNLRYRGTETVGGVRCIVFEGWPEYTHPVLKHLYHDYEGKFYLEKKNKKLKRVVLRAKSSFNRTIVLAVRVTFKETGRQVKLPVPH